MIRTSVIIPVYNTVEYLRECVESVLAQTQKEIEIILIDDGSDDGSWEMAQEYARNYPFIHAERQEHLYQGTARNRGLKMAKGEYVYFMDSDDAILPALFETCYRKCEEERLDFVMFDAKGFRYDENDRELEVPDDIVDRTGMGIENRIYDGPEFWNSFYNKHGILYVCWLLYIRRSYLLEHGLFYEERTYFEDNDWMLRMYLHAAAIRYLPAVFHRHRWRRGSNMLDGFTAGLLEGCFRMHAVLLKLHEEYKDDLARARMTEDVLCLNLRRFDRLKEIRPEREYTDPLAEFCGYLKKKLNDPSISEFEYGIHLAAAIRILRAARTWEDGTFCEAWGSLVSRGGLFRITDRGAGTKLCIFGTGKVGQYYAKILRDDAAVMPQTLFFADSNKEDGEFFGFPLVNSRRIPELQPDVIVIASTRFGDEMEETVKRLCGNTAEIVHVPGEIRFLM